MDAYSKGDDVEWDWGNGTASGTVQSIHTDDVEKTIKGTTVRRTASDDCPAYSIRQDDGDLVLKAHSEIRRAS